MPRGRSYSWDTHHSDGPVILEREPDVRNFANPFKSRKPSAPVVRQQTRRRPRGPDRLETVEARERARESGGPEVTASMSRGGRQGEFVPLPPRIPIPRQEADPIVEIVTPRGREPPEVHQPRRNSFDLPMNRSPVRIPEPERIIASERDRRRQADRHARLEARRRQEVEQEMEQVRQAAARERDRRREVNDIAQRMRRVAINERENRREAEAEARRLAAEKEEAEDRARQAEYELERERQLAERERERAHQARIRQAEMEGRAEVEAQTLRRRPVHIVQRDMPFSVDRGAEVLRLAQEADRRRREDELLYRMERDRRRDPPRRPRSITIFEDDDGRWRHRI